MFAPNCYFDLSDEFVVRYFAISNPMSGVFHFVHIHQIGKHHMAALELFRALSRKTTQRE